MRDDGTIVKQFDYAPFGAVLNSTDINRTKFIGKEKDKESNYADHGVRKYDDEIGRFTSIDPLWEKYYSLTPYQYAGNNPVIAKDADGRETSFTTLFEPVNKSNYPSNAQPLTMPDIVNNSDKPGNQKLIDNLKEIGIIGLANVAGEAIATSDKIGSWLKSVFGGGKEVTKETAKNVENKIHHIFDKPEHNFKDFLKGFNNNKLDAYNSINNATSKLVKQKNINGIFEETIEVNGSNVVVRGNVINGEVKIGTAFIK